MPLFDPRRIIYHDYGGSPENREGMLNPYHSLVFPSGEVRHRYPEAPYAKSAPHAFLLNPSSLGLSYAGPVGSKPTSAGMRGLQGEYEKMQRDAFPRLLPGIGHGEAGPAATASSREAREGSWRDRIADLSQVPETGLPQLSLLGGEPAQPAQSAQPAQIAVPMGAPQMPMSDAQEPGYFQSLMTNPMFMAGLSVLGTQPGGNWGPNAAAAIQGTLKSQMAQTEYQRQQQQRAQLDRVWKEAFPNGQPNPNHPLTKGMPPEFLSSVYALGPDKGVPQLANLAMSGAQGRQKLALQQQQGEQMARAIFGDQAAAAGGQSAPSMPAPAPVPASGGPPISIPGANATGTPGSIMQGQGPGQGPGQGMTVTPPSFAQPAQAPAPGPVSGPVSGSAPGPYTFQGGQRSAASGEAVLNDPQLRRIMYGHIMAGKSDEAMKAYSSALEKAQAPRLAGETEAAKDAVKRQAEMPKARASVSSALDSLGRMEAEARAIHDDPALGRITGASGWFPNVPGSAGSDVQARLKSLVSQIGFSTLQAMREASKTGGALGNVSERELEALQNTLAGLDTKQSTESFKRALQQVMEYSRNARARLKSSWQEGYGTPFAEPGGEPEQSPATFETRPERKRLGKKSYVKINGQWFEE